MTGGNAFVDAERFSVPVNASATPVVVSTESRVADVGKVGGVSGGAALLFETDFNTAVFKLPVVSYYQTSLNYVNFQLMTKRLINPH